MLFLWQYAFLKKKKVISLNQNICFKLFKLIDLCLKSENFSSFDKTGKQKVRLKVDNVAN